MLSTFKRFLQGKKPNQLENWQSVSLDFPQQKLQPFDGIGCVMVSDVTSFSDVAGKIGADHLLQWMAQLVKRQHGIITKYQGAVERFSGLAAVSYWQPDAPHPIATNAMKAACEIVAAVPSIGGQSCLTKISFAVAACAGNFFGDPASGQFQVVGPARQRAERTFRALGSKPGIAVDVETLVHLAANERAMFQEVKSEDFVFWCTYI